MKNRNPVCLQLYLPTSEKEAFKDACFQRDTTMSRAIRKMIRAYVNTPYEQTKLYYAPVDFDPSKR